MYKAVFELTLSPVVAVPLVAGYKLEHRTPTFPHFFNLLGSKTYIAVHHVHTHIAYKWCSFCCRNNSEA